MGKLKKLMKKQNAAPAKSGGGVPHIHCVACGRHIDPPDFVQGKARWTMCAHGTKYAACRGCQEEASRRLDEHDRTGRAVEAAPVWH